MDRNEEWNEFLSNMLSCTIKSHEASKEYEYQKQRQEQIDEILTTNFKVEQKDIMEEILFEVGLAYERENEIAYRQGLKDCAWLLKNLGVLA